LEFLLFSSSFSDIQEDSIGTKVLTRSLTNEFEAEDLTDKYKTSKKSIDEKTETENDIEFQLNLPEEIFVRKIFENYQNQSFSKCFQFGSNLQFELNAKNKSKETRTITVAWTICLLTSAGQKLLTSVDLPIQTVSLQGDKGKTCD